MRVVTGLQATQYYEPETAMDCIDEELQVNAAGVAFAAMKAMSLSTATSASADAEPELRAPSEFDVRATASGFARSNPNGGMGWVDAQIFTDEGGNRIALANSPMIFVLEDGLPPIMSGYDESGPVYTQPEGRWLEFDQSAFDAAFDAARIISLVGSTSASMLDPMQVPNGVIAAAAIEAQAAIANSVAIPPSPTPVRNYLTASFNAVTASRAEPAPSAVISTTNLLRAALISSSPAEDAGPPPQPAAPTAHLLPTASTAGPAAAPVAATGTEPLSSSQATATSAILVTGAKPTPETRSYVGEASIDPGWLAKREAALLAVRADYVSARAEAQSIPGAATGWIATTPYTDESGAQRFPTDANVPIFIADPEAQPEVITYDESGPVYKAVGQWWEFDEATFVESYQALNIRRAGGPLQALATLYGTDAGTMLVQHLDVWHLVVADHVLNAGSAPGAQAMGDKDQLGQVDLYLADPQIAGLIDAFGGTPAPAIGAIALEQVRIYGARRYAQLGRLSNAMQSVGQQYQLAMDEAGRIGNDGVGWVERQRSITVSDESGIRRQLAFDSDGGAPTAVIDRVFDPDIFTAWYIAQPGIVNAAIAEFYGQSHVLTWANDPETGVEVAYERCFDRLPSMPGLEPIDLNTAELYDPEAVAFDLNYGWVTSESNIKQVGPNWFEIGVTLALVAVAAFVSGGLLGPALAAAAPALITPAVATGMAAGLGGAVASGILNDNLTLKGALLGMFAGGLSAELMQTLDGLARLAMEPAEATATSAITTADSIGTTAASDAVAGQVQTALKVAHILEATTVHGCIQLLLGGDFKGGALTGLAAALADLVGDGLLKEIDSSNMSGLEASSARAGVRIFTSALRVLGHPDDPLYAFASDLMSSVIATSAESAVASGAQSSLPSPSPGTPHEVVSTPVDTREVEPAPAPLPTPNASPPLTDVDGAQAIAAPVPVVEAEVAGFIRNNGERANPEPRTIVGTLRPTADAAAVPQALLPKGITVDRVSPSVDGAGNLWYVVDGSGPAFSATRFTDGARQLVGLGVDGLRSGAITPSDYLDAVRFINVSDPEVDRPVLYITLPSVAVASTAQSRQSAILQGEAQRTEMARWNITPVADPDSFVGPLTTRQAELLVQTDYLLSANDAERFAQLRDSGQLISLGAAGAVLPLRFSSLITTAAELYAASVETIGLAGAAATSTITAGRVLVATAETISVIAAVVGVAGLAGLSVLVFTGNEGQKVTTDLNADQRFVTRPGDLHGTLEERNSDGEWRVSKTDAVLVDLGDHRVVVLTDDELKQLTKPSVTPGTPLPPSPPLINVPIPDSERPSPALPGPSMDLPAQPIIEIYPADPPMTWQDLLIEKRDSAILGHRLAEGGEPKPAEGFEAHHIVPSRDRRAEELRQLLNNAGIDLNSKQNGIWLPGKSIADSSEETPHNEASRDSYFEYLESRFEGTDGTLVDLMSRLELIKNDLRTGKLDFPKKG